MLAPGSTIGIMGGGQLGRMLATAAAHMGYKTHIFCPGADAPAEQVASHITYAEYDNRLALTAFASSVNVVTFEFENVPDDSLEALAGQVPVHPSPKVLATCRNRLREKEFVSSQGIQTAPYRPVVSFQGLEDAVDQLHAPCILKTTELGYDGKGQARINDPKECKLAWMQLHEPQEAVLEGFVDFESEISVIAARNEAGEVTCFPPITNIHRNHILDISQCPASIGEAVRAKAMSIAEALANALNLVGLLAVEMFVTKEGEVIVNELAPRPHNSGHLTMEACETSQFEQHIRAICGLSLGATDVLCAAEMKNLIGEDANKWAQYASDPRAHLHLYGKHKMREGRKMGHVTTLKHRIGPAQSHLAAIGKKD